MVLVDFKMYEYLLENVNLHIQIYAIIIYSVSYLGTKIWIQGIPNIMKGPFRFRGFQEFSYKKF